MNNKIIVLFLYFIFALSIYSQNKYKTFNNSNIVEYRKKDGLPSNNITSVAQTLDGYLWFSGPEGTFRFDGYEFAYIGEEYDIPEMQAIYYDSLNSTLYFASTNKFATFDGNEFRSFDTSSGYKLNENRGQIVSFVKGDSKGRIWIGSYTPFTDKSFNGSLVCFKEEKFTLYDSLSFPLDNAQNFIETPFGDLIFTSFGKNTQNGDGAYVALFKDEKFTKIDESFGYKYINAVPIDNYSSNIDKDGNTWIAFTGNTDYAKDHNIKDSGVLVYDGDTFKDFPGLDKYTANNKFVSGVFCDNISNKKYVNLAGIEPKKITQSDLQIFELINNSWQPSTIIKEIYQNSENSKSQYLDFTYNVSSFIRSKNDGDLTLSFFVDGISQSATTATQYFIKHNDLWQKKDAFNGYPIYDLNDGKLILTAKGIGFLTPSKSMIFEKEDGVLFPETAIPQVFTDRRGLVWIIYSYSSIPSYIVLSNTGLNVWDGEKLRTVTTKDGLKSNIAFLPYQDKNYNIWIPTDKGVTQIREVQNSSGEWIFKFKNIELKSREFYNTSKIIETAENELYVIQDYVRPKYGPISKADFFLGKIVEDEILEIKSPYSKELQQNEFQRYFIRSDNKGQVWLEGLFAPTLDKLSSVRTEIKIFTGKEWIDPPESWNIPNDQLHFVGELDNGAYYLTADHFYNFDGTKFIDLSDSTDEYADYTILKGASVAGTMTNIQAGNYLYIRLRGRGLVVFDGKNLKFLTPRNSIVPTDIHNPEIDHNGNVFFGSHTGGVKINGEKATIYYDDEKIAAGGATTTTMDIHGNIVKFYTGIGIAVEKQKKISDSLRISSIIVNDQQYFYKYPTKLLYSENSLLFNFSVLNFNISDQILYEHFLEGYDKEWSRPSNLSFTEYQNLPHGSYTFNVRVIDGTGENSKISKFSFVIDPPIWKTWWAYLSYVFIFFGFLYSVRKFELKRQKKNAAIKEGKLRAEAAEAQARAIEAENQRKTKELEEARKLQLSMLPKELPTLPNFDIAAYIRTATEVGGDYYDFHVHLDGTLTVIIGDATGHGMQSGMMVSIIKSLFMSDRSNKGLVPFFQNTNKAIKDMQLGRLLMALASIQFNQDSIKLIIAGMPPIYHYKKSSKTVDEISTSNFPLGAIALSNYDLIERKIESGDTFLLMSDGFAELRNSEDEMIGYKNTLNIFEDIAEKTPDEIIDHLKIKGSEWSNGKENDDDVTFVIIKVK